MRPQRVLPWLLAVTVLVAACGDEGTGTQPEGDLFRRYVALGNSITSGFESGGINDSTQMHAYPVLLAQRAGAEFEILRLQQPGCPAPLLGPSPLTAERVGGASATSCAGALSIPHVVQNLAIPGIKIADGLTVPEGRFDAIFNQLFGGRTVVDLMIDADPTLVSVWLGNNDALSAGLSGDPDRLTPLSEFRASLDTLIGALANGTAVRDAILISVIDPQTSPLVEPGAFFWAIKQDPATSALLPKPVSDDCAPEVLTGQPNPRASNLVSLRVTDDSDVAEISCADDAPYVLSPAEQQAITTRVSEFNAAIRAGANANGWIYIDANALVQSLLSDPNRIRKCQDLATATTPAAFQAAVQSTCPGTSAPNFFGSLLSFDGYHPSAEAHEVFANAIAEALRVKHGIELGRR